MIIPNGVPTAEEIAAVIWRECGGIRDRVSGIVHAASRRTFEHKRAIGIVVINRSVQDIAWGCRSENSTMTPIPPEPHELMNTDAVTSWLECRNAASSARQLYELAGPTGQLASPFFLLSGAQYYCHSDHDSRSPVGGAIWVASFEAWELLGGGRPVWLIVRVDERQRDRAIALRSGAPLWSGRPATRPCPPGPPRRRGARGSASVTPTVPAGR